MGHDKVVQGGEGVLQWCPSSCIRRVLQRVLVELRAIRASLLGNAMLLTPLTPVLGKKNLSID